MLAKPPDGETLELLAKRVLTPIDRSLHHRLFELAGLDPAEVPAAEIADPFRWTAKSFEKIVAKAEIGLPEAQACLADAASCVPPFRGDVRSQLQGPKAVLDGTTLTIQRSE